MKINVTVLLTAVALLTLGCGGSGKANNGKKTTTETTEAQPTQFPFVMPPETIIDEQGKVDYVLLHYWDDFDFTDLSYIGSEALNQGVAVYAMNLTQASSKKVIGESIDKMLRMSLTDRDMFYSLYEGMEYFLAYPNSEIRNNDLYIIFLETLLAIDELEPDEKIAPAEELRMAKLNVEGTKAMDFKYTIESGKELRMHDMKADYLLVYFYNLGCPMCREVSQHLEMLLTQNHLLDGMLKNGRLKVLMVYPPIDKTENALEDWKSHKSEVPSLYGIINSYDKDATLYNGDKYDLSALPSLYLLDKNKTVLLRDFVDPLQMAYVIEQLERQE